MGKCRCSFSLLLALFALTATYGTCSAADNQPNINENPKDEVYISGEIPQDISIQIYTLWQTTLGGLGCQKYIPMVGAFPLNMKTTINIKRISDSPQRWAILRDAFLPGRCGWILKSIDVYADRSNSGMPVDRKTNISNRIAYIISPTETQDTFSWAENDDVKKPVRLYCNFKDLIDLDKNNNKSGVISSVNPCALGWSDHHGTDAGKKEHILRQNQHDLSFIVENHE